MGTGVIYFLLAITENRFDSGTFVMFEGPSFNGVPITLYMRRHHVLPWWLWQVQGGSKPYTRHVATIAAH